MVNTIAGQEGVWRGQKGVLRKKTGEKKSAPKGAVGYSLLCLATYATS